MGGDDIEARRRDRQLPGSGRLKRRLSKFSTVRVVNPIVRGLLERGLFPKTHAVLETTGRVSGKPRRTPVGNGLRGDKFWIVTEHGWASDYVKNIQHNPRVRVKIGRAWHSGIAELLPEEDPRERLRKLDRPVNDSLLKAVGTEMLVIRVNLEDPPPAGRG